jgi:acetyl-CoA carboxylase biotin carboxyl carrier protein
MIDFRFIEKLLDLLNSSNAAAIEVKKNWWSTTVRISKTGSFGNSGPVTYQIAPSAGTPVPAPSVPAAPVAPVRSGGEPVAEVPATTAVQQEAPAPLVEVKSPMVGTFYAQPEPGAEPYVRVSSRITPGQTLCIIEAMKIMNPIDAEISGVIKEVSVQDAQPVEFGQVLFRVDPNG